MIAAFVFQFVAIWNDLMFGITLTTSRNVRPIMAALAALEGNYSNVGPPWSWPAPSLSPCQR